jgi:hypothetical protein
VVIFSLLDRAAPELATADLAAFALEAALEHVCATTGDQSIGIAT